MRLSISHRIATPLTAAAAAAGLILLGLSPASADPGQTSNQGSSSNLIYKKSVVGGTAGATLKPGDTVTYKNEVIHNSGVERYVTRIRDIPPAGFVYESGSATGTGSGANIVQEADGSVLATCSSGCSFLGGGFVVKSGQNLTYTVTYKVPANAPVGIFNSGMFYDVWSFGSTQGFNPANVNVQVLPADVITNTTVSAPATANTGEQVNLTATVDPTAPGSVQFKDGTVNIGGPVTVANGTATLPHTFDTIGAHAITAVFTAGNGFVGSTSPAQTVNVVTATTTTLTVPATAVVGADVTIEATIAPATAPGQVQFKDGNVNIGDPVTVANGTASITRKFPEAKSHSITAHFVGTGGYNNSDSAAATLNVTDADFNTTTTVLEPVTATVGVPVNLAATVMPIPDAGQVEFTVDGVPVGTADVGTGDGVATLPHTFTTVGTANVVAKFVGTAGFTPSTSAGFSVTVKAAEPNREATTTALAVSGPSTVGQAMTFKATVAPAGANGTVQFKAGTTEIGAPVAVVDGVATLSHTFDTAGTYGITAVFTGGAGFADSVSGPTVIGVTDATDPGTPGGGSADFGSLASLFNS